MFLGPSIIEFQEKNSIIWKKKRENNLIHNIFNSSIFKIYGIGSITYNGSSSKLALRKIISSIHSFDSRLEVICFDVLSTRIFSENGNICHITNYYLDGLDNFISISSDRKKKFDIIILHGLDIISTKDRDNLFSYIGLFPNPCLCINIMALSSSRQFTIRNILIWNIWSNIEDNNQEMLISCNDQS